ncbi:MAG: Dabb family protein [Planctomycetales bacterium]|nr:Dabb family protein [Planctomycetales bacterium]
MTAGAQQARAEEAQMGHMVFFTLKEGTPEAKQKLVDACDKYLTDHEGTVYYSAGVIAEEMDREVNDRDFHVALHVVFKDQAAHDKYQTHPRHLKFIEENKDTWAKVRVFDSWIRPKK